MEPRSRMTAEQIAPEPALLSRVESFFVVRSEEGFTNTLPPHTAPVLAYRLKGLTSEISNGRETVIPRLALTGVNLKPRAIRYHPGAAMLIVRFREGAAGGLFPTPLHEVAGSSLSLDTLMDPAQARELADSLEEAVDERYQVALLGRFFRARWERHRDDPLVAAAVVELRRCRGQTTLRALAQRLATNLDTLEKRFRGQVGVSPKRFLRLVRFQGVVETFVPGTSLAEAAAQAGYYDESHLVREFRSLTGQTPSAYLNQPRRW